MSPISETIRSAYAKDEQCAALLQALKSADSRFSIFNTLTCAITSVFVDHNLLIYCTDAADTPRIVVPHDEDLKYRILYEAHDTVLSGHLGRETTYNSVSRLY